MNSMHKRLIVCGLLLGVAFGLQVSAQVIGTAGQKTRQQAGNDAMQLSLKGRKLSAAEAESLEQRLAADPSDLEARFILIGYYTTSREPDFKRKRAAQAFWLIENIPDSSQLDHLIGVTLSQFDEGFDKARKLWLKQLELHPGNTGVLSNATNFFLLTDKALSEKLMKAGAKAEPNEPRWHNRLGHLHMLQVNGANFARIHPGVQSAPPFRDLPQARESAELAYVEFEVAYKLTSDDAGRRPLITDLAKAAFEAGKLEQARQWATTLVNQTERDWNYGNAIHQGHLILGRLALMNGNVQQAKEELIAAGNTPGSPQLNSSGPNMTLARELLEKGERDSVLQYFELCAKFWVFKDRALPQWTATVKGGGIPNFGGNLDY